MSVYIKNAFVNSKYNLKGSPASVEFVDDMNNINYMLSQTQKLKLPISVFLQTTNNSNKYYIRYFIDAGEEPICGHGTLVSTKFLADNKLIDITKPQKIEFIPLFNNSKYGDKKQNSIFAEINGDLISIFISVIEPQEVINKHKKEEIINSINLENKEYFDIVNIVEGEFDYTIEIKKSQLSIDKNISSLEIINMIKPDFDAIEKITLSNGKICRGIDVVLKNKEKEIDCDYFIRIFLPYGALPDFKEDPACGSGTSYVLKYLSKYYPELKNKELKFYQASQTGAFLQAKMLEDNTVKVSGYVE